MSKEKELKHFFNNTVIKLGIYDWKLNFKKNNSEGYCWKNKKIINIGLNCKEPYELILHEIAHINSCRFCNQKHNYNFWRLFKDLMRRFLPNEQISKTELNHMKYSTEGYYNLNYE